MIEIKEKKKQLIECLNIIGALVMEVDITFNKEDIFIRAVHPSNHCMIILKIASSLFEKYEIEKEITYTLDIENLLKIIKNLSTDTLQIFPEKDILVFKDKRHKYKLNYFVGSKDERLIPIFEHKSKVNLKTQEFFDDISKSIIFDQIGSFEIIDNKLFISSKSHIVKGKIEMIVKKIEGVNDIVYFDLSYIDMIKDLKNLFEFFDVYLDSNFPLRIKCKNTDIDFEYILANRVENE